MDSYLRRDISHDNTPESRPESHPLRPFIPAGARLLMCGTFPPQQKRWSMPFYYPNFINDMWRIFGIVFYGDKNRFVDAEKKTFRLEELKAALTSIGVALSDTGREVVRTTGNASDKDLDIRQTIDLPAILAELPDCIAIATTGEKAASVIAAITGTDIPPTGECRSFTIEDSYGRVREMQHWRMPSSSRAYPLPLEKKAAAYSRMFTALDFSI